MSDDRFPAPLEAIVRAIAGGAHDDDDRRASTFARGLALGALVGAAIAGSTIWQRRHGPSIAVRTKAAAPAAGPLPDRASGSETSRS